MLTSFPRFVESLTAKVYAEPPSIEMLSNLFQDFYVKASSHISTHVATLALRIDRGSTFGQESSRLAAQPITKQVVRKSSKESVASLDSTVERQMLTASEVAERKKTRKLLEYKRLALEESVERRACEKVYDKLWRHKSTLDDVRDEKLRSKTAALALVGIGLKDLGIELDQHGTSIEEDIRDLLAPAREELTRMNHERTPLGKLQRLTNAHKTIVDTLSTIHPASSSADEILPTLIYTLITSPPEGINIISNLSFVERFRTASKVDGEAAYCMTNLEAAIVFLENVDLASLREDELPQGPPKTPSRPETPARSLQAPRATVSTGHSPSGSVSEKHDGQHVSSMMPPPSKAATVISARSPSGQLSQAPHPPASPLHQRRISNLLNPPAKAIGAANDAVRNTAEEGFKNISSTLDNSFKFLFGRLKEHGTGDAEDSMPQTLEDARKLVSQSLLSEEGTGSETSPLAERCSEHTTQRDDKLLNLIGGRAASTGRDRSVDSVHSSGSGRRSASAALNPADSTPTSTTPNNSESAKSLGSSFNPLSHLGSAFGGGFKAFGRPTQALTASHSAEKELLPALTASATASNAAEPPAINPPIQRFVDLNDAGDMTVRDVSALLRDYQRLAKVVDQIGRG